MPKIETGKPSHCLELVTGKNLTGTVLLSNEQIITQIYSFHDHFRINGDQPIFLRAETTDIVSLHSNITAEARRNVRPGEPERTAYRQGIISNIAVIGHNAWAAEDGVKRVTFRVQHTKELMHHREKVDALGRKYPNDDGLNIYELVVDGMTLRARYSATYGMDFDSPKEFWPSFEIEFEETKLLEEYIRYVLTYVQFLSFCFGVRLKPSAIQIDRLSFAGMIAALEKQEYRSHHVVHYNWPEFEIDDRDLWVGGSPVRVWDDQEVASFRSCLALWMELAPADGSRTFRELKRSRRFLTRPSMQLQMLLRPRLVSWALLRPCASRLLASVEEKFGRGVLPGDAISHLKRALALRGKSAHGHFNPENEREFRAFVKSVRAMEALCYLLTAQDLPISEAGIQRVRDNRLIRDYRASHD
jgi:hypothetical protein